MPSDVVSLTEELIALDTAPGRTVAPLAGRLGERLAAAGAAVRLQPARGAAGEVNLLARFGGADAAGLVLAGHIDTVPWQEGERATTRAERDGRRLYGRGACDMKGAVAAFVLAAERRLGSLRRPLLLALTYAEETGCHGALDLVADPAVAGGLRGAVCIVGEPTDGRPITAHKGYAVARIALRGQPAHSSDPWSGCDASVGLGVLLRELHALREELRAEGDPACGLEPPCTTLNTGVVRAGTAENVVPDRADLLLEWRPVPRADAAALRARVQGCIGRACAAVPGLRGELDWPEPLPAFHQPSATPLVDFLVERTGRAPGSVAFYTEAELYRSGLALPTVVCGPGSIAQAHRVDESILFDELEAGVELYADAITAFCG